MSLPRNIPPELPPLRRLKNKSLGIELHIVGSRLNKAELTFALFLRTVKLPVTEQQIIAYYAKYIQRLSRKWVRVYDGKENGYVWDAVPYQLEEVRRAALAWFDRRLGSMVRKQYVQNDENLKLNR